ncbi:hypothetical protein ACLOJK_006136 [Asimina triloba]
MKKKHLIRGKTCLLSLFPHFSFIPLLVQRSPMRRKKGWQGRRRPTFKLGWLSYEEARWSGLIVASPKAPTEPIHLRPVAPVPVVDVEEDVVSLALVSWRGPSEAMTQMAREDSEAEVLEDRRPMPQRRAELAEAATSVGCGVLGATLGEVSSCSVDDEIFRCPLKIEARALKILGDLLSVQSRSLKKSHALGQTTPLDKEG